MESLKYPIGKFELPLSTDEEDISNWIHDIESLPDLIKEEIAGLKDEDFSTSYREGGWTIRKVIHHIPIWEKFHYLLW
jgi:hypothetical protein